MMELKTQWLVRWKHSNTKSTAYKKKAQRFVFRTVLVKDNYYSDLTSVSAALCLLMSEDRQSDKSGLTLSPGVTGSIHTQ